MADARGGRGQARGGRGGGHGSFPRGGGGDPGGHGGGNGFRGDRGGRGGFAPRRDAFEGEARAFYGQGSVIPQPNNDVTNLENAMVKSRQSKDQALVKKMGSMKLTDSTVSLMPRRPAYGTKGRQIVVWVNYFPMSIKPLLLYRYILEVRKGESADAPADDPKSKRKGKEQAGGGGAGGSNGPPASVPKRKLRIILQHALAELRRLEPKVVMATECKSQLVSLNKLQLAKNPIVVKLKNGSATREELYNVEIVGETNDRSTAPSLVGMVASVDRDLGQWPAVAWEQPSRQEMLGDELTGHFKSRPVLWRQRNQNKLPEFIIIYRVHVWHNADGNPATPGH